MKMNEARKGNLQAVIQEDRKNNNPNYNKSQKLSKRDELIKAKTEELEFKGIKKDQGYLDKPAIAAKDGKKKSNGIFGWDVFNTDSLYRAYNKRSKNIPFYPETYKAQMDANDEDAVAVRPERLDLLATDLEKQEEKRKNFSRRRMFDVDNAGSYVNERNRVFNNKLNRYYG